MEVQRLEMALAASCIGTWELDLTDNSFRLCERFKLIFDHNFNDITDFEEVFSKIHAEDQELVRQKYQDAIAGNNGGKFNAEFRIALSDVEELRWINFKGQTVCDDSGQPLRLSGIVLDVTDEVETRKLAEQPTEQLLQQAEESQLQLLALFEQSPVAIAIVSRDDLRFTMANKFYGELVGRKPEEIIGKTLSEVLPELVGQGFHESISEVINTGISCLANEQSVDIMRNGKLDTIFINSSYQPQRTSNNQISGVLVVATDVTQQVLARQKIQEAETTLRGAVELANLGTWQIDLRTGIMDYSQRLKGWFGIAPDEVVTIERAYRPIRESDRPIVQAGIIHAMTPGTDSIFDVEYTLEAAHTGKERILHAQGKAFVNDKGEKFKISGTVHDVTEQREVKLALEQQVQERTEELEAINEELAAINEEYLATNEELSQSNELLSRSNENLQRFAYVASHDLQEPLRKIQSFGDLLNRRFADNLGAGADYLKRMQLAARRMSVLIDDLLAFSRVSSYQDDTVAISLNAVIKSVITDLEFTIQEANATVYVGKLPIVLGDPLQLGQLYQNLLSNALKFRRPDTTPEINVTSEIIDAGDLPSSIKPSRPSHSYHRIDVKDNGIGFDDQYTDRIFQIFQRLHGKNEFAGTGIGLAICEKVAANHGGAIAATSKPGNGATFSLYLPV